MSRDAIETVLTRLRARQAIDISVAVVVAHPDDETIGLGPFLHLFRRLALIHVTDGAPRDMADARAAGFDSSAAYAAARRAELRAALRVGGCSDQLVSAVASDPANTPRAGVLSDADHPVRLPVADQSASLDLAGLAACLRARLATTELVFTHAYEAGHPDHDAVAFAVQASGVPTIEMAAYHAAPDGGIEVGVFLAPPSVAIPLTRAETERRNAMLACFETQRSTLAPFTGWTVAQFRPAPRYDFTRPPASRAYYDGFSWGMTSHRWCALAAGALAGMAIERTRRC